MTAYDIIIIGSGPAGVSAAFPLVEAGLKVLMLDAGRENHNGAVPPEGNFLDTQPSIPTYNGRASNSISPKLKMPAVQQVLEHFQQRNQIATEDFIAVGALATGGLSTIWGAGVAFYDNDDLRGWPISYADLAPAYTAIAKRIGISGSTQHVPGDLSALIQSPLRLDKNHQHLLHRFSKKAPASLCLWQSNNAVLSEAKNGRLPCNYSGLCLWGCARDSIWNAEMDLDKLKRYPNFKYISSVFVEKLEHDNGMWRCISPHQDGGLFAAPKILLAAGTMGSTRIVLSTLKLHNRSVSFRSNPSAAFMLWLPQRLQSRLENAYGMAQLSFSLDKTDKIHGNLFSAAMIPRSEYIGASSLPAIVTNPVLSAILSSSVVGNCFFSGDLSDHSIRLSDQLEMHIQGRYQANADDTFSRTKKSLIKSFLKLGAVMIPGSFRMSAKGADIHYAATLPMNANPSALQTDINGQLAGHAGLYIVDGSVLPHLPAKPLTLTIMANAHRIAKLLASQMI